MSGAQQEVAVEISHWNCKQPQCRHLVRPCGGGAVGHRRRLDPRCQRELRPNRGAALIYTVGSVLLLAMLGFPRLGAFPRRYLIVGSALFVSYEICLSLSLGFAADRAQAIELGIVNYLWPCLTVVFAMLINGQRASAWVVPGIALSLCGIAWVVGGSAGLSWERSIANVASNPVSYGLAFCGAIIWAVYCNVTKRYADGKNGVALFFMLTAAALWVKYLLAGEATLRFAGRRCWSCWSRAAPWRRAMPCGTSGAQRQPDAAGHGFVFHAGAVHAVCRALAVHAVDHGLLARRADGHGGVAAVLGGDARPACAGRLAARGQHTSGPASGRRRSRSE